MRVEISLVKVLLWFLPVVAALSLWLITLAMPTPSISIALGNEEGLNEHNEAKHLYSMLGWGAPEEPGGMLSRRGEQRARFAIPWAFRLGSPLKLTFVLSDWGITEPIRLQMNDTMLHLPAHDSGWRTYSFLIPHTPSIYERDLYLEWQSATTMGPLLHHVELHPFTPEGNIAGVLWLGGCIGATLIVGRKQPPQHMLIWGGTITVSAVVGHLLYAPQLLPWNALLVLGGTMALVLTQLVHTVQRRLVLWALMLWTLAAPQVLGTWVMDDAFISFRYAKNLLNGIGLTYNPGEVVEGYTNFLWTMIMAGCMATGLEPVVAAQCLCMLLSLATLLLCYRFAVSLWGADTIWSLIPPLILACSPPFLLYTARGSGMETALVTFLTVATLWSIGNVHSMRSGLLAGFIGALAMMTRPDGVLVVTSGGMVLLFFHENRLVQRRQERTKHLMGYIGGVLLLYGPYYLWRYTYYGYLLPNTFYAKVGATQAQVARGIGYVYDCMLFVGGPVLMLLLLSSIVGLVSIWIQRRNIESYHQEHQEHQENIGIVLETKEHQENSTNYWLLWLFVFLTMVYIIGVGGDQFPFGRFFIPILPPLALLTTHGMVTIWVMSQQVNQRQGVWLRVSTLGVLVILLLYNTMQFPTTDSRLPGPVWTEHKVAMKNADMGHWLARNTPPDTVIATAIAGALPYYAGQRYVIDMLGLNDTHIAHMQVEDMGQGIAGAEKTDNAYVLDRQPDYIPWATSGELQEIERFERAYELIKVPGPLGGQLRLYRRIGVKPHENMPYDE